MRPSSIISIHLIAVCPPLLDFTQVPEKFWRHNTKYLTPQWKSDCCMRQKFKRPGQPGLAIRCILDMDYCHTVDICSLSFCKLFLCLVLIWWIWIVLHFVILGLFIVYLTVRVSSLMKAVVWPSVAYIQPVQVYWFLVDRCLTANHNISLILFGGQKIHEWINIYIRVYFFNKS